MHKYIFCNTIECLWPTHYNILNNHMLVRWMFFLDFETASIMFDNKQHFELVIVVVRSGHISENTESRCTSICIGDVRLSAFNDFAQQFKRKNTTWNRISIKYKCKRTSISMFRFYTTYMMIVLCVNNSILNGLECKLSFANTIRCYFEIAINVLQSHKHVDMLSRPFELFVNVKIVLV